jgi:hypothetical protein
MDGMASHRSINVENVLNPQALSEAGASGLKMRWMLRSVRSLRANSSPLFRRVLRAEIL